MHAFSYAWSLPVTWRRWQSQHSIHHRRKLILHANLMALCFIEPQLLPLEDSNCANKDFRPFWFCSTLTRWPSYAKVTHIPRRYTGCANTNFLRQGFWKLSPDRQTDRQTDTAEIIYLAASRVVKNQAKNVATKLTLSERLSNLTAFSRSTDA